MMMVLLYKKISKYLLFRFSLFGLGLIVFGLLVANAIKQMPPKEALAVVGQLNMTTTNTVQTIVNTTTLQTTSLKIGATEVIDASRNLKNIGAGSFSGNVGIGTTSPGTKLDVQGSISIGSSSTGGNYSQNTQSGWESVFGIFRGGSLIGGITSDGTNKIGLSTGGYAWSNAKLAIDSSGNVGIGITNPGYKLDVTSPAGWQAKFGPNATTYVGISENQISGFGGLFYINSTSTQNVSMVNGGGNVGIGTVSPVQKLDIAAPPNEGLQLAGTSPTITFKDADNRTGYWHFNSDIMYLLSGANGAGTAGWSQVGGVWPLQINTATNATTFGGTVTAPTFVGALSGNATTATTANAVSFNSGLTTGSGPTFADVYVNGWFRNNASLQGLYNQANGNHFYSETATRWTVTGNGSGYGGLKFRDNHQSTVKGNIYYDGSGFGMLNNADNWMFYTPYNTQTVVFPGTIQGNLSGNATSATNQSGGTVNATTAMIAGGSSSNWASLNIGGSNSINAGGSIYSYDAICVGNSSGHCDSTGGVTLGRAVGNAYITTGGTAYFGGNVTGPIFYDANNAGYYLNPDGTSNLYAVSNYTRAAFNLSRVYTNRRDITADQSYWTGTNGWSAESTWDNAWKYGFGGLDMWGTNTGHPQGAGYIHAQGIMSGEHAAATDGSTGYGWMMVGAHAATENRYWLRGKWGGSTSGWVEMITTGNIASQSVSYANSAGSATNVSGGTISMNDNKIWFRSINDDNHYLRFENLGTGHDSNGVRFHEYGGFRLSTLSASSALEILTNGNVGIGTASPAQKLHVNGSVIIDPTSAAGYTEGIRINTAPNGYSAIFYGGAATSVSGTAAGQWWGGRNGGTNSFQFVENGVPMMTILPTSGSVGIGIAAPGAKLDVDGSGVAYGVRSVGSSYGFIGTGAIGVQGTGTPGSGSGVRGDGSGNGHGVIAFGAGTGYDIYAGGARSWFAGTVNVGGTVTAPAFSGNLSGNATTATTATTANAVSFNGGLTTGSTPTFNGLNLTPLQMYNAAGEGGVIKLNGSNGTAYHIENINGSLRGVNSGWTAGVWAWDQAGNLTLGPGANQRLTINASSGNAGIQFNVTGASRSVWMVGTTWWAVWDQTANVDLMRLQYGDGQPAQFNGTVVSNQFDLAENVLVEDTSIEAGDIVIATPVLSPAGWNKKYNSFVAKKASTPYTQEAIGMISEKPGLLMRGYGFMEEKTVDEKMVRPLTLSGRVPLKISTINGDIKIGDAITTSSIPGVGMKATKAGYIVGRSLENYSSNDPKAVTKILVMASLSWYDPNATLASTEGLQIKDTNGKFSVENTKTKNIFDRIGAFSEIIVAKLQAGIIETKKLIVDGVDVLKKLNELSDKADKQQTTIEAQAKLIDEQKKAGDAQKKEIDDMKQALQELKK